MLCPVYLFVCLFICMFLSIFGKCLYMNSNSIISKLNSIRKKLSKGMLNFGFKDSLTLLFPMKI